MQNENLKRRFLEIAQKFLFEKLLVATHISKQNFLIDPLDFTHSLRTIFGFVIEEVNPYRKIPPSNTLFKENCF